MFTICRFFEDSRAGAVVETGFMTFTHPRRDPVDINDLVSIDVFARNLTDEEGLTWIETEIGDGRANYIRPRTIGIQLRALFGQ